MTKPTTNTLQHIILAISMLAAANAGASIVSCDPPQSYVDKAKAQYYDNIALASAVEYGNAPEVRQLLDDEADVNAMDEYYYTVLMIASENGHHDIVKELLQAGASMDDAHICYGQTALTLAAEKGHVDIVKELLNAGADANAEDGNTTALMAASHDGDVTMAKMLLNAGADVNAYDGNVTALMWAAHNGDVYMLELLLNAGADVNKTFSAFYRQEKIGYTALYWAVINNELDAAKYLIRHGAEVNAENQNGITILRHAINHGKHDMAQLLREAGAE